MKTMTYSESRANFAEMLNGVVDDREEVVITRTGREPVVVVSLEDYQSLKETAYLLRSPANARRLLASLEQLEAGHATPHELVEDEEREGVQADRGWNDYPSLRHEGFWSSGEDKDDGPARLPTRPES